MLPFLLVVLSSLCTLTHAASIPSHVSFLKGGQSDEEICVYSNCPDQPAFNGPAIHKATSPVEANGDQMSADYGPFVICTYEDNTRVSYDAYGYIYSLTTDRQPTETQPDRLEGFDRSRFIDQTCTPPPPPSPPLATDNNADEQSSPVTVPSADGPPPSTDTPPQPPSSTTAPACENVCPPENEYEGPLSSTVQGESDFTCWYKNPFGGTDECAYDNSSRLLVRGYTMMCAPKVACEEVPPAATTDDNAEQPSPVTPLPSDDAPLPAADAPAQPQASMTITTCQDVCPELLTGVKGTLVQSNSFNQNLDRFDCSYPNAAGFDRCTYSHETRNIIDRTTNLCVSSLGLQACTTTVSSSRRRRVETPYSRALKARQWSKDKLAKKIMKKDV